MRELLKEEQAKMEAAVGMEELAKKLGDEADALKAKVETLEEDVKSRKERQNSLEIEWENVSKQNTTLSTKLNKVKYEKKVIEENTSAKRVAELEAEVENFRTKATKAENALATSQDAYKGIASAFDKHEREFEDKVKQAIEFKPVMQKLLKESVMLTTEALINLPTPSHEENNLTPLAQLMS